MGHDSPDRVGIDQRVRWGQPGGSRTQAKQLAAGLGLQADCLAGVWGHAMNSQGSLEAGELEEALRTAQAIGDDRLQQQSAGRVVPDSFTHGTSQQRYTWFKRGYDSGDPNTCDTFGSTR